MALDRDRLMRLYAPRLLADEGLGVEAETDEEDEAAEGDAPTQNGVMVAFFLSPADAARLAVPGGEPAEDLHVTLAYLGQADDEVTEAQLPDLLRAVDDWAAITPPVTMTVTGVGQFHNPEEIVNFAAISSPGLVGLREALSNRLADAGLPVHNEHAYTPHITLQYGETTQPVIALPMTLTFDSVVVAYAGRRQVIRLAGSETARAYTTPRLPEGSVSITTPTRSIGWAPIVTNVGDRTILTGPATIERAAMWGSVPNPNPHMLWMQGRFVGAEIPNRNNALWSVEDLEMGHPTVAHGPLNWLHEDKHVIGTIADAQFVPSRATARDAAREVALDSPGAMPFTTVDDVSVQVPQAHITALSAIWRWLYPDEAAVVEMASDSGSLAYSMECISEAVECAGDNGCGERYSYMEVSNGQACSHLKEKSSVRRLVNPTFLGGAVIVPPTRPGWGEANAEVMRQAAAMAEKAYDQAGRPNIPATEWEQMMAAVLRFARA